MSGSSAITKELFADKSLLAVYRKSRSYSENRLDRTIRIVSFMILSIISLILATSNVDLFPIATKCIYSWTGLGFTYATTILGFLVAGFTIFSTMTRTEVFIALSRSPHETLGVSQLKFVFYSFLKVFILHIVLIFSCVAITMLKDAAGIYLSIFTDARFVIVVKKVAVSFIMPSLGYLMISTLLHLKTFVWNLYQSIIIAVAGAATMYELEQAAVAAARETKP